MNDLIFDRTQSDVTNKTAKGYYNATDLNRVESWCKYLADELNSVGYNINITTKLDWTTSDLRSSANMERIRSNIYKIMTGFHYITTISPNANQFDYIKANNWEKILFEIFNLMWGMKDWYVYSGVANSGQNRVWQNRFRHFFEYPPIVVNYIESLGHYAYFDTGVPYQLGTRILLDFELTDFSLSRAYILGAGNSPSTSQRFSVSTYFASDGEQGSEYSTMCYQDGSTVSQYSIDEFQIYKNVRYLLDCNMQVGSQSFTLNDYNIGTFSKTEKTASININLFSRNGNSLGSKMKFYGCKIYINDVLVRDFVPAFQKEPCLLDKVSNTIYRNLGSNVVGGEMTYG